MNTVIPRGEEELESASVSDAIVLDRVCKRAGRTQVLKDVSLNVPVGSIFGLVGRSGAGKTTTLKVLLGLTRPTSGTASVLMNSTGWSIRKVKPIKAC